MCNFFRGKIVQLFDFLLSLHYCVNHNLVWFIESNIFLDFRIFKLIAID